MAGPEPKEAIDKFLELQKKLDITMIQGNTDWMIANYTDEVYNAVKEAAPVMAEALKNDFQIIPESQRKFLKNLPEKMNVEVDGVKILLVHGSPRKNNENILPDTPLEEVEKMIDGVNADVVLCGHTHMPCGFQTSNKLTVVNDGSVGRPFTDEPKACYLLLNINDGKCLFEHKFVEYDNKKASEKMLKRTFEGREKLAQTLIKPTERHF
jgi:putative phosphoesterase